MNPGWLYPLRSGLAFVERPPLFLPAAAWDGVALGRAEGPGASFDLTVSSTEFSLLPRDDMAALRTYLAARRATCPPMPQLSSADSARRSTRALAKQRAAAAPAPGLAPVGAAAGDESDSEGDEDFAAAAGDGESDGSGESSDGEDEGAPGGTGSGSDSDSEPGAGGWGVRPAQQEAPPAKKARLEGDEP